MNEFKIKENGFKEIRKQILIHTIPLVLIAAAVGIVISEYGSNNNAGSEINVLPYVIPIIIGALALGLNKGIKRQKVIYESYNIKIDDTCIIREQANTSSVRILFTDIKKITKTNQGGLVITGNNSSDILLVPSQIDDMASLENILQANCTTQIIISKPLFQRLTIPLSLAILGLMTTTYISTNKLLVSVCGTTMIIFMILSLINIQTNKNIDKRTKRSSYLVIIVILSIIGIMVNKLMTGF